MRIFNFNEEIRSKLSVTLLSLKDSNNLYNEIFEYFNNIKNSNENIYKILLGIMFCDTYIGLNYRQKENRLSINGENSLNLYKELVDIDDLIFFIDEHQEYIVEFYFNSIKFHSLNKKEKAKYFSKIDDLLLIYLNNFSKTIKLEKEYYFGDITAIDLLNDYNKYIENNKNKLNTQAILIDIGINSFCEELSIISYGNIKAYQNIIISLLRTFYIWKSFLKIKFFDLLDKEDLKILKIIENNDIKDIFYKNSLIYHLVSEYIYFHTTESILDRKEMEEFFDKNSSEKIKIKLKEV